MGFTHHASADEDVPFNGVADAVVTGAEPGPDGPHLTLARPSPEPYPEGIAMRRAPAPSEATAAPDPTVGRRIPPAAPAAARNEVVVGSLGEVEDLLDLLEAVGAWGVGLEVVADGRFRVRWS